MNNNLQAEATIVPLLVNGKKIPTTTTFDVVSPCTCEKIWRCSSASRQDALDAVVAVQKAQPAWEKTKPAKRRKILLRVAELLEPRRQECFEYISHETGAPQAYFNASVELLRDVAGRIAFVMQGDMPICAQEGTNALVLKEPYGVNLGIAPWSVTRVLIY